MARIKSPLETEQSAVVVLDSKMMRPDALRQNPSRVCPQEILEMQQLVTVRYVGFNGRLRGGQMVIDQRLVEDVKSFFDLALELQFPIEKVVPAIARNWDDDILMSENISSGFNFRTIAGTEQVSLHGLGRAFDINPRLNPYVRYENKTEIVAPEGARHDKNMPGTLFAGHPLVMLMKAQGWEWGGDWPKESGRTDYQHFQKG